MQEEGEEQSRQSIMFAETPLQSALIQDGVRAIDLHFYLIPPRPKQMRFFCPQYIRLRITSSYGHDPKPCKGKRWN